MIPTRIGQKFEGGYLAGVIRVRDSAYAVLVALKSTECSIQVKTRCSGTPNTQLVNDGWSNTNAMNDVEHPAAQYCRSLNVGGYADFYLPSRDELELCYRNLKPTDWVNATYSSGILSGNLSLATGTTLNSIPSRAAYTETNPAQTIVNAFQTGGIDAFDETYYWTSTESSSHTTFSLIQYFSDGGQYWNGKTSVYRVRGIRRVLILLNDEKHNDTN